MEQVYSRLSAGALFACDTGWDWPCPIEGLSYRSSFRSAPSCPHRGDGVGAVCAMLSYLVPGSGSVSTHNRASRYLDPEELQETSNVPVTYPGYTDDYMTRMYSGPSFENTEFWMASSTISSERCRPCHRDRPKSHPEYSKANSCTAQLDCPCCPPSEDGGSARSPAHASIDGPYVVGHLGGGGCGNREPFTSRGSIDRDACG